MIFFKPAQKRKQSESSNECEWSDLARANDSARTSDDENDNFSRHQLRGDKRTQAVIETIQQYANI